MPVTINQDSQIPMSLLRASCLLIALASAGSCPVAAFSQQDKPFPATAAAGTLTVEVRGPDGLVAGAEVRAAGLEVRTDAEGSATLRLPAGNHLLSVTAEGFLDSTATATIEPDVLTRVAIVLVPQITREDQIIVTASRTERRIDDQPLRVEVVDRDDIEEKALMTPGSVAMLLGETTGLRVQTTAPSLGAANVRIQGLRGRYSQLLSDGLPLYGLQGDSFSLLQVPPLDLAQVEIINGAASALYGASALGGVINLVSQRPAARHREVLFNQSTQAATDAAFWMTEPPRGRWGLTLLGGLHGQTRQDLDEDGWADLPQFVRGVFRPRLFWDNGHGSSLFATMGVMAENRRGGTIPGATAPDGQPFPQDLDTRRIDTGVLVRLPAGHQLVTVRGSFAYRGERRVFGAVLERGRHLTWFGEAVIQGTAGRHSWLVGAAVAQDSYVARDLPDFDYTFTVPGLIAQDEISFSPKLTLGLSMRADYHSEYGAFANPRVSLLYKPVTGWTNRFSAGTGFFAPTPFVEETEETGLSYVQPLRNVVAEQARSISFDTGYARGPFEVVGTLFASYVRDPIERRILEPGVVELANSDGPIRTSGAEFLGRFRTEGFTAILTHNYTIATEENPDGPGRRDVPLTPRNVTGFTAIWEGESWGRFGIEYYYTSRQPLEENPYRQSGRGYGLFGALFERRFGPVRAFINLENLGNIRQTHYDPLVRPARAPDGRWTVDAWAPLDGRVINGGIRVTF